MPLFGDVLKVVAKGLTAVGALIRNNSEYV